MTYSEELKAFRATHTYETKIVEGSTFHYVLSGKKMSTFPDCWLI